jgi:hypothetical protein
MHWGIVRQKAEGRSPVGGRAFSARTVEGERKSKKQKAKGKNAGAGRAVSASIFAFCFLL